MPYAALFQAGWRVDIDDRLYQALGRRIRTAREAARFSQEELARRVGLTRTSVTNIEHGRQRIQVHVLYALARALAVDPEALLPPLHDETTPSALGEVPGLAAAEQEWVRRVIAPRGV